jgi:lipopolysaccharide heptosyltransferase II
MRYNKLLIINPFGIGDVLFSFPLVEALKDSFPDSFIGYVCNRRASEIIKTNPSLNKVFIYEKDDYRAMWQQSKIRCVKEIVDFLKSIKDERFDIAIDLSLGYQYSLLLMLIGIKRRCGFNYRDRGIFLTDRINISGFNSKHVIEHYLDILTLLNIDPPRYRSQPKINVKAINIAWAEDFLKNNGYNGNSILVGIIPGCGASWGLDADYRRWNADGFAKVCDFISKKYGAKIILLGDINEIKICKYISDRTMNKPIMACGKTDLGNLLGLLSRCALVITNDGGPLHMAVGINVSTISIFGPVDEKIYGPYPEDSNDLIVSKNDISCRPCYKNFKYKKCDDRTCLNSITPEDVIEKVEKILSK